VVWEGLLGNFVSGARLLSVGQYSLGVANAIAHQAKALNATQSLGTSAVMGVIVTVVTILIAVRALSSFSLKGDAV
jgi:ABC-2 type transport system permease protein